MTADAIDTPNQSRSKLVGATSLLSEFRWPLIILAAHLPMLVLHLRNMANRPQYQYFPLVFVAVVALIWTRLHPPTVETKSRRFLAHTMFAIAAVLLVSSSLIVFSPWMAGVAFVIACGGAFLLLGEHYAIQNLFGIWAILWLLIPLPGSYEQRLSYFLQRETTSISGSLLEKLNIPNFVEGTVLSLPGKQLFVEEACSGIVSMMTIIASCLILAVWSNRAWIHTVLLVVSGIGLAAVTNILRVVTLSIFDVKFGMDIASGWPHDILGLILFLIAVSLAFSSDQLLSFFLSPIAEQTEFETEEGALTPIWNTITRLGLPSELDWKKDRASLLFGNPRITSWLLVSWVGIFSLLGAGSVLAIIAHDETQTEFTVPEFADRLNAGFLPHQFSDWQMVGFSKAHADRLFAQNSRVWAFQNGRGDLQAMFSFDFSFDHFHDLCVCYEAIGWTQSDPPEVMNAMTSESPVYLKTRFKRGAEQFGLLLNSCVDRKGNAYDPPGALSVGQTIRRRLQKGSDTVYQIQLWIIASRPFDANDERMARELFESQRRELQKLFSPTNL